MSYAVELTPGSQVWFDGDMWTITEFGRGTVTLNSGQSIRTVSIRTLATSAVPMTESSATPKDRELVPIVLGMLDSRTLAELERRAEHVRAVLDAPCSRVGDRTRAIERKAKELNISAKTLRRWIAAYAEAGVAGLADSRITRKHPPSVDPRWDAACAQILRDLTNPESVDGRRAMIGVCTAKMPSELGQ